MSKTCNGDMINNKNNYMPNINNIFNAIPGLTGNQPLPTLTGGFSGTLGGGNSGTISAGDVYGATQTTPLPGDNAPYGNGTGIDGINPVTPTPTPTNTGMILSSTRPQQEFNSYQTRLDALLNQPDPFAPMYDQLKALNQTTQDNAIASATTASARAKMQEEQSGRQYQAGLATAGQQTGTSRYLPEYQLGLMESARNSMNDRVMQLDQAEKMAIAKAQQARIEGDVMVLKEQLNQINEMRKEKIRSLERAQEMDWEMKKFNQQMALDREKFAYAKSKDAEKDTEENFFADAMYSINQAGGTLTPTIFKQLISKGIASGEDRETLLETFATYIPKPFKRDKKNAKSIKEQYGITDIEYAKIFTK